ILGEYRINPEVRRGSRPEAGGVIGDFDGRNKGVAERPEDTALGFVQLDTHLSDSIWFFGGDSQPSCPCLIAKSRMTSATSELGARRGGSALRIDCLTVRYGVRCLEAQPDSQASRRLKR